MSGHRALAETRRSFRPADGGDRPPSSLGPSSPADGPSGDPPTVGLVADHPQLSARDALHVPTCVNRAIGQIVSVDSGFDAVAAVRRIEPIELAEAP